MARNTRKKRLIIKDEKKFKKSVSILLSIIVLCIVIYNAKTILNIINHNTTSSNISISENEEKNNDNIA